MAVDDEIGALEAEATAVSSRTFGDHRRSALKALAQLLPFAPFFTELWSEYVPTRRERRQVDFIAHDLARALDQVKQQVDQARILTDPYADVFEDVLAAVATRRGLDKRALAYPVAAPHHKM